MGKYNTGLNGKVFWIGALATGPIHFMRILAIPFHWDSVVLVVAAKLASGCMLSFFSGLALAFANDLYKHQIKHRFEKIVKPKIRKNVKDDNERAA
jgi:hypothetical protein